ncbi:MAG TPA: hypothetical protein P5218_06495, partial [Planctomycetota bacterium]|nr:hypothetical protein [Planctomycetota bacterium]
MPGENQAVSVGESDIRGNCTTIMLPGERKVSVFHPELGQRQMLVNAKPGWNLITWDIDPRPNVTLTFFDKSGSPLQVTETIKWALNFEPSGNGGYAARKRLSGDEVPNGVNVSFSEPGTYIVSTKPESDWVVVDAAPFRVGGENGDSLRVVLETK